MLVGQFPIMKSGDFVSIDYVGKVKETGEIFDVTIEDVAKKENVFNPKVSYRPINVVVDANFVIKGLDDALKEMKVGDKKTVVIEPENAFGPRDVKYIRPIPLSNFKEQKTDPTPGSYVSVNGIRGKILSVDGGRIRVDFNHPLAGKVLEYEIEIKKEITDTPEKVKSVVGFMTGIEAEKIDVKMNEKEAEIKVEDEHGLHGDSKKQVADLIIKWIPAVEKIRFVDEYGK